MRNDGENSLVLTNEVSYSLNTYFIQRIEKFRNTDLRAGGPVSLEDTICI